jgi:type III secretion protein R
MELSEFTPASALVTVILVALAPFVAVMVTDFTKIIVVLSLLRNALGLQQTPPNIVLNGLALILSVYVMYPVISEATQNYAQESQIADTDIDRLYAGARAASEPIRGFLDQHAERREKAFFLKTIRNTLSPEEHETVEADDFVILLPAFTVSELGEAFQIGFLIYLPFLIIDLVVSNILLALGMMMLSPTIVSLPFKLLLFVLLDGWVKLAHGLVLSYSV